MVVRRWAAAFLVVCAAVWAPVAMVAQWNPPNSVVSFEKQANGVEIHQKDGVLKLEVDAPDVLHVTYSPLDAKQATPSSDHVVIKTDWPAANFDVSENDKAITLTTAKLKVAIERESGCYPLPGRRRQATNHRRLPDASSGRSKWRENLSRGSSFRDLRLA